MSNLNFITKNQYINYLAIGYMEAYLNRTDPSPKEIKEIEGMLRQMNSKQRRQLKNILKSIRLI